MDAEVLKKRTVEEEADETQYWLELLMDPGRAKPTEIVALLEMDNP